MDRVPSRIEIDFSPPNVAIILDESLDRSKDLIYIWIEVKTLYILSKQDFKFILDLTEL